MTRTAEKIRSLVREDDAMSDALDVIRERADANGGEIDWSDVRDDLTSGQWGRIIEKGLLVDGERGFQIADREGFDAALDDENGGGYQSDIEIDEEASRWSQWDKMAAIASVLMMVGYWTTTVRDIIGGSLDLLLAPLDATLPFYAVILAVAMITGLYSTLLQANLMNMDRISMYQQRMKGMQSHTKEIQEELKRARKDDADDAVIERLEDEMEDARKEQMEAMAQNLGMFKEQFRPMVWIMLLTIPLFLWMYWKIHGGHISEAELQVVLPMLGSAEWNDGFLGPMPTWILWYFLCSMGFTQLLRKSLNIDMTPDTS